MITEVIAVPSLLTGTISAAALVRWGKLLGMDMVLSF
jgi:hypothetical protein